jgi:heptosyltransferase-2
MALPALRAVRAKFSDAEIAVVARPYVADIYRDQQICNQLINYDADGIHAGFSGRERLADELRAQKFDVALLLQNAFDAAWLAWRANIPERVGYARDGRGILLTKPVSVPAPHEVPTHEKFYYLELLRRAGWMDSLSDESFIALTVPEVRGRTNSWESGPVRMHSAWPAAPELLAPRMLATPRFAELGSRLQAQRCRRDLVRTAAESAVSNIKAGIRQPPSISLERLRS